MSFYGEDDIGSAQQFFGTVAPWAQNEPEGAYRDEGRNYTTPIVLEEDSYRSEGSNYPTPESTQGPGGSPVNASMAWQNQPWAKNLPSWLKNALSKPGSVAGKGLGLATSKGGMAGIMALLAMMDKRKPSGGGTTQMYAGPKQLNRSIGQGKYGPIAQYAATGGTLQGYAQGGPVQMEHGGFVMTEKAVNGAGGPQGIRQLVPGAQMIRGPGTGTSDSIKGVINGPRGQTPALVSNGEAYVPKQAVQDAGGSRELYALMNQLQRRG